jgi:DNA (cytosine-5)-methyltransferase 1
MSRRKMLVADLLCGAGGSSTGAERALRELGLEMELVCVNHWPTAIETHTLNHPQARHFVQDIATVRPHLLVPEGYLDLLMASPTCTHHSVACGGKPTSDQQRSDPWHIITWLTELRVKRIIIENVWEFTGWGPVDPATSKPIPERKGEYFYAWIETLRRLGFDPEWRKLNAANYGDATTRQRFILKARSDLRQVGWAPLTHAKRPDEGLALFPTVKPWRPAREIIDWKLKGKSILNRKKPLAPKTLARIWAGAVKFGWPEPYLVILRNHMGAQGLELPVPAIMANGTHIGLAEPVLLNLKKGTAPHGADDPIPTQTSSASHISIAEPIVLSQHNSGAPRSADEPLPTITTGGAASENHPGCARPMLIEPFVVNGRKGKPRGSAPIRSLPSIQKVVFGLPSRSSPQSLTATHQETQRRTAAARRLWRSHSVRSTATEGHSPS